MANRKKSNKTVSKSISDNQVQTTSESQNAEIIGDETINFNNVTPDKKGCGFRHEEFPMIILDNEYRERYLYLTRRADNIQRLLYNIPRDLNEWVVNLYLRNIIEIKLDITDSITKWWDEVCGKYNLPHSIKYNAYQNIFYRHITDDNQVTNLDRINNR
jgi:hypothetical protein